MERLARKVRLDFDTARRLFTLICVLHWKGEASRRLSRPQACCCLRHELCTLAHGRGAAQANACTSLYVGSAGVRKGNSMPSPPPRWRRSASISAPIGR